MKVGAAPWGPSLRRLAQDICESFECVCYGDNGNEVDPEECECGGDGTHDTNEHGCWRCEAERALINDNIARRAAKATGGRR
jgi:hypothetical protein